MSTQEKKDIDFHSEITKAKGGFKSRVIKRTRVNKDNGKFSHYTVKTVKNDLLTTRPRAEMYAKKVIRNLKGKL